MYINFARFLESGLTPAQLLWLIAIRQKEKPVVESIPEEELAEFESRGFTEKTKSGSVKMTKKGVSFLTVLETAGLTDEISTVLGRITELYEERGKDIGTSRKEAEKRLIWFMSNTGFKGSVIVEAVADYLEYASEYTLSLCNLIWKPATHLNIHMTIESSKLFDIIASKYGLGAASFFTEKKNSRQEWLFQVSKLPNPPAKAEAEALFTGNAREDAACIKRIKKVLTKELQNTIK